MIPRRAINRADRMTNDAALGDPAEIIAGTDGASILDVLEALRPRWHEHAACAGEPAAVFFPERGGSTDLAYQLCGRCPVREDCLAEALDDPTLDFGIRGGMSTPARKQRRRLEAKRRTNRNTKGTTT